MATHMKGLKEFVSFIDGLTAEVEEEAKVIVRKATLEALGKAKKNAPVDTGYLRNSISASFKDGGMTGIVSVNAEYAIHVEFGTFSSPAQPFMYPAYYTTTDWFKAEMNKIVGGRQ